MPDVHIALIDATYFSWYGSRMLNAPKYLNTVKNQGEQVIGFTEQLKNLQDILQNSKQRGALGEYFLETTIKKVVLMHPS